MISKCYKRKYLIFYKTPQNRVISFRSKEINRFSTAQCSLSRRRVDDGPSQSLPMTAFLLRNPRIVLPFFHHQNAFFSSSANATASTPIVSRRRFRSAIVSSSDPERIFSMLYSSDLLLQNRETANIAVSKISRRGRRDLVEKLLEPVRLRSDNDEKGFIRVMWLYSSAGMVEHALKTFDEIPSRTEKSVCALLGVYLDNHLPGICIIISD